MIARRPAAGATSRTAGPRDWRGPRRAATGGGVLHGDPASGPSRPRISSARPRAIDLRIQELECTCHSNSESLRAMRFVRAALLLTATVFTASGWRSSSSVPLSRAHVVPGRRPLRPVPPDAPSCRSAVNCVTRSTRSSVPVTSQSSDIQDNLDAFAIARNVRMKQSATAPTSNVSGDHRSPGPSNSAGDAD